MADSSTSSLTSTSHTLTIGPSMTSGVPSLGDIRSALAFRDALKKPERRVFMKPAVTLPTASTQFTQVALGEFAGQISDEQQERLRLRNAAAQALKKRKRNGVDPEEAATLAKAAGPVGPLLKIRKVHIEGFELPQIWQQSNRILAPSLSQLKHELEQFDEEDSEDEEEDAETPKANGVAADSDSEDSSDEEAYLNGLGEEDLDEEEFGDEYEEEDEDLEDMEGLEVDEDDEDGEDEDDKDDAEEEEEDDMNLPEEDYIEDKEGLNDGFFDIDRFNKESQWFEDQDARADPKTDEVDDEEEFDWGADPLSAPSKPKGQKKKAAGKGSNKNTVKLRERDMNSDEEEDDDDEPPAFADMDLNAPFGESDDDMDNAGNLEDGLDMDFTANDIYYKDFFAPPARKREPGERPGRPRHFGAADSTTPYQPEKEDIERAMADVRRDLFDEVSEGELSDEDMLSDAEPGDPKARRSTHERQQAKILAEIRKLEAEAVKEKDWTLTGEASAGARPVNSLLGEDLDFEYIGKPVPVITQEVNEDIESLVKRRILAQEFDEVRRRYATGFGGGDDGSARRGLAIEIDDQQAKKGLAAVYEEEHQKNANPDTYISQSDERLQAEERAVEALWSDISSKLDALSSWHYKPRPAEAGVTVVADVATVSMEDAQPATAQGVSGSQSMLAPQEIYKPGAKGELGAAGAGGEADKDIVTINKSGLPVAREEMSREDRKRRHRRNKERIRKSGSGLMPGQNGAAAAEGADGNGAISRGAQGKSATLAALKKAGVKVIGRKGEIRDLDGNTPKAARPAVSQNFKL